jgi:hypothetical protein
MKRTLLSLMVVGLFAGVGTSAMAQNVTAGTQPDAAATSTTPQSAKHARHAGSEKADRSTSKAEYKAAKAKVQTEYKDAKAKCVNMEGDARRSCMTDARAVRSEALAQAKTQRDTPRGTNGTDVTAPATGDMDNASAQPRDSQQQ